MNFVVGVVQGVFVGVIMGLTGAPIWAAGLGGVVVFNLTWLATTVDDILKELRETK